VRLIQKVGDWFDLRLQLGKPIRETAEHPVPRETASWFYVFGSAALTCFVLQIVTGILLALIYVPSAGEAWNSLQTLNHGIALGWFHTSPAWVGFELHGRDCPDSHGPSFPVWSVQSSQESSRGSLAFFSCS